MMSAAEFFALMGSVGSWTAAIIPCTEELQIHVLMEDQLQNALSKLSPLAELCGESWRPEELKQELKFLGC